MRVDKQILSKASKFLHELKSHPKIDPFLDLDDITRNGLFDFKFVNRNIVRFSDIELSIKENKYSDLSQILGDFRTVFESVSNYVPLNDPLQQEVKYFYGEVNKFKNNCEGIVVQEPKTRSGTAILGKTKPIEKEENAKSKSASIYQKRNKHYDRERQRNMKNWAKIEEEGKQQYMPTTNAYKLPKLEMIYFLKAHETNEPFIHMIGDMYHIGNETENEYVIKLDNSTNCTWLDVLKEESKWINKANERPESTHSTQ